MTVTVARARKPLAIPLAMLAYGIAGAVLLALAAALLFVSLDAAERLTRSVGSDGPNQVATRLAPVEATLAEAEVAVRGFEVTLDGTSAAAQGGRDLMGGLAASMRGLAASLDVVILGSRPFAAVGAEFGVVADDAATLSRDLGATAVALEDNRAALARLATQLGELRREVSLLREDLGADGTEPRAGDERPGLALALPADEAFTLARLVLMLLLVWLAVPAIVAAALGVRQLRDR